MAFNQRHVHAVCEAVCSSMKRVSVVLQKQKGKHTKIAVHVVLFPLSHPIQSTCALQYMACSLP